MKTKEVTSEFIRYIIVGGSAFIIDFTLLYLCKIYLFNNIGVVGIYISTAIGFTAGLIYNYILSLIYVFESAINNNKGKNVKAFLVFSIIGIAGLIITEIGMYVGIKLLLCNYLIVKIFVAGIVLLWNYGARKILIF